ncbi:MAG: BlaI/MecI/CopY family transcriptional regulator [Crenarchaeota archaeon]|nr:BlaI/MecI/CopY family transcriptional regulator [Thermoproteota archaeon]
MARVALNEIDYAVIGVLYLHGPCTVSDIQKYIDGRYITIYKAIKRLEKEGIVVHAGKAARKGRGRPAMLYTLAPRRTVQASQAS